MFSNSSKNALFFFTFEVLLIAFQLEIESFNQLFHVFRLYFLVSLSKLIQFDKSKMSEKQ